MNKYILFAFCFLLSQITFSQINVVINPGMESYYRCPTTVCEIKFAKDWYPISDTVPITVDSFGTLSCTPSYCNACASSYSIEIAVPNGGFYYYHNTHSGNGMAYVLMFTDTSIEETTGTWNYLREYLQGRLYHNLHAGTTYCVSFYVVLTHSSAWAINHIGAYLDNGSIDTATNCGWVHIYDTPQVYANDIINDTINWYKVEGSFTANGTETFITIGNFFDSAHTDKTWTNFELAWEGSNTWYTYYLVDDVSVIAIDDTANAGIDRAIPLSTSDSVWVGDTTGYLPCYWYRHVAGTTGWVLIDSNTAGFKVHPDTTTSYVMQLTVCGHTTTDTMTVWVGPVSVRGSRAGAEVALYPNPAGNEVTVEGVRGCEVHVLDMVGRCLVSYHCSEDIVRLPLAGLEKGMYFVEVVDVETGVRVVRKLVKS